MPRARIKAGGKTPFGRQIAPLRRKFASQQAHLRLASLSHEFEHDIDALKKHQILETVLTAVGGFILVTALFASLIYVSPRCSDNPSANPPLLIGGVIKVAGC